MEKKRIPCKQINISIKNYFQKISKIENFVNTIAAEKINSPFRLNSSVPILHKKLFVHLYDAYKNNISQF